MVIIMGGYYGEYYDLARRVEDTYQEVDCDACVDLRENDEEYSKLWLESIKLQDDFPVIEQVVDGNGEVSFRRDVLSRGLSGKKYWSTDMSNIVTNS